MSSSKLVKYGLTLLVIAVILSAPASRSRVGIHSSCVFAQSSTLEQPTEGIPLPAPGTSTDRELPPGETHSYPIVLEANQYLHAIVEQHGTDANLAIYGPDGLVISQLACRQDGPTPVSLIARASGRYWLKVSSVERTRGRYQLRIQEIRPARAKDQNRIDAEKAFADGELLLKDWKAVSSRKAIDKFKDALPSLRTIEDNREEALTLKRIGDVYQLLGEFRNALSVYGQALSVSRQSRDLQSEARALNDLSYLYLTWGDNKKAQELCDKALSLSKNNQRERARALNNLGEISYGSGKLQQSIEFFRRALSLWNELGDRQGLALTLLNFGYTYSDSGQSKDAFNSYNQALVLWEATGNIRGQAITLTAIGRLYSRMGESQEALSFFERAALLIKATGDPIYEAAILTGMAYIYDGLGEKQRALEYYDRALSLFRAASFPAGEASALGDVGRVYFSIGNNQKALECHQIALSIFKRINNRRMETFELREIGRVYDTWGDKSKALKNYVRAHSFYRAERELRGEADTLNMIGRLYEGWGDKRKALAYYEQALPLSRKAAYRFGEATTLHNMARVERDSGSLTAARTHAEESLGVVESLRDKINVQELRTSYFATVREQYEFYIDLLMRLHRESPVESFQTDAFEASERARARSLLETLAMARVGVRENADPNLLAQESKLRNELNDRAAQRMRLQPGSEAAASVLAKEIDELAWQLREIEAQIRASTLKRTAAHEAQPLGLQAIQERVIGADTLLLEYWLGEERSFLWTIGKNEIFSYELPGRAEIEMAARNVYNSLTANQPRAGETLDQQKARVVDANQRLPAQIASLSKILLGPVASKLGTKRLLIVADGALQYIPFQILTKPDPNRAESEMTGAAAEARQLLTDHEIVNEPSASALALLIGDTSTRKRPSNSVAVFADPVFEVEDPRITPVNSARTEVMTAELIDTELHRALRDVGMAGNGSGIPRLLASRDEAEAIMAATPWWSGFKAMGFDANRATAMTADLADYRIVHFATHGFLNDEHPELSGVVLSLFDEKGRPQEGFLRLHDIYNLKLPVDLVVLSACNTGLGKDVRGEGLIGLTRGFMYAGASSVVASLWKVDDDATAVLMGHFYRYMLGDGLSPAAALRKAQIEMANQKRWQSPYYWSGFIIQGQYVTPAKGNYFSATAIMIWGGVTVVLVIAAFFVWRVRRARIL